VVIDTLQPNPDTRRWIHDLRNGINTLRLCTSALEVCSERDELLELVGDIERAADKVANLSDQIPSDLRESDAI
jgi:hypothetical protein